MRTAPTNWNTVINGADPWWYEASLFVQRSDDPTLDYTYAESEILSIKTKRMVFDDHPAIGVCYSAEIDAEFIQKTSVGADPPTNGKITPRVRVNNGTTASNWLFTNSYYIDTRSTNHTASGFDTLTIHGYDAMRFADAPYATSSLTWPALARQVVGEIASAMGVSVHPDTANLLNNTSKYVDSPIGNNKTYRDVLSEIGVMYCGNWIIGGNNYLNFYAITRDATPNYPSVNITPVQKYSASPQYNEFEGVILTKDEEGNAVTSGDPTGYAIEAYLPNATQTEADDILADLAGWHYKPFEADGALLTPLAELQDQIQMNDGNGETFVIYGIETTFGRLMSCTVCAPSDEEVQHEFAFEPASERRYQTTLGGMTSSIQQNANRIAIVVDPADDSIKGASIITAINDDTSAVTISASKVDISGYVTFSDLSTSGQSTITGANITTGIIQDAANKNSWNLTTGALTITNGSINVTTSSSTYDVIKLAYSTYSISMQPYGLFLDHPTDSDPTVGTGKTSVWAGSIRLESADGSNYVDVDDQTIQMNYQGRTRADFFYTGGIRFYDGSGNATAIYPADASTFFTDNTLRTKDLAGNQSYYYSSTGSASYTLVSQGLYLVATARANNTSAAYSGLWLVSVHTSSGSSNIIPVLAPSNTSTTASVSGVTLTVTRGTTYSRVSIIRLT